MGWSKELPTKADLYLYRDCGEVRAIRFEPGGDWSGYCGEWSRITSPTEWDALEAERDALKSHAENMGANWKSAEAEADRQRERATFAELERLRLRALLDAGTDAEEIAAWIRSEVLAAVFFGRTSHQLDAWMSQAQERIAAAQARAREEGRKAGIEEAAVIITDGEHCRYIEHMPRLCDCGKMAEAIRAAAKGKP